MHEEVQFFWLTKDKFPNFLRKLAISDGEFHKTFKKLAVLSLSGLKQIPTKHSCSVFKYYIYVCVCVCVCVCMYVCMYVCICTCIYM